jgi:hypothetical protein
MGIERSSAQCNKCVLVSFTSLWRNTWDNQRRKDLLWFIGSVVSVHGWLDPFFLGLCWGRAPWLRGMGEQKCLPHDSQEAERWTGNGQRQEIPFKALPSSPLPPLPVTYFLQQGVTSQFLSLLNNTMKLLLICQWSNPLKSEPSWSKHFPRAPSAINQTFNKWDFGGHFRFKP